MPDRDPLIPDYAGGYHDMRRRGRPSAAGITALVFTFLAAPCLLLASWYLVFPSYGSGYGVMFGACGAIPLSSVAVAAARVGLFDRDSNPTPARYAVTILVCLWAVALLSLGIFFLLHKS